MHLSGVVFNAELHGRHPRSEVELVEGVIVVTLLQEGSIGGLGEVGFVIEQMEQADGFLGYQTDDRLIILNNRKPLRSLLAL